VLEQGRGDCQARAVVLASILHAKGIPARFVGSFDHLWVDYPGKRPTALENAASAVATQQADGSYRFKWPQLVDWRKSWDIERGYFWDAMPAWRSWLLLSGWLLIGLGHRIWRKRKLIIRSQPGIAMPGYEGTNGSSQPLHCGGDQYHTM
jgi:hypothetical protein